MRPLARPFLAFQSPWPIPLQCRPFPDRNRWMSPAPTKVRFSILTMATIVAFIMYLDRICLAEIVGSDSFKTTMILNQDEVRLWVKTLFFWLPANWQESMGNINPVDLIKGAFFWAYAFAQVPAGWLSDRFGARTLIAVYIAAWSFFTVATSFSWGFTTLMLARLGCGLAEAGYYPASSGMLTRWAHVDHRGFASSMISWGGRVGGFMAPVLTAYVILKSDDWRWAGYLYGFAGLFVAAGFWWVYREHPRQHPRCNQAEINLLAEGRGEFLPVKHPPRRFPWKAAVSSGNLWFMNGYQFLTNIGWAFLILTLSDYLKEVIKLEAGLASAITSTALFIGIVALPIGGVIADRFAHKFGLRRGRMLLLSSTRFLAAGCYLLALAVPSQYYWLLAVCFGAVAFTADLALPATWATMQDISGKHQAQLFGWSNMWGNFGAGIQPILFAYVLKAFDLNRDFSEGILLCAGAFALAGFVALGIDASKPVVKEDTA
jgi:MFS family permease